jgi:hypothetical protein
MSLEVALQENTKAVLALVAALSRTQTDAPAKTEQPAPAPAKEVKAAPQAAPAAPADPIPTPLNYEKDVKPLALKLVNAPAKAPGQPTGRDRMVETLKKYTVRLASEIPAEKLSGFVKDVQAELAALGVK